MLANRSNAAVVPMIFTVLLSACLAGAAPPATPGTAKDVPEPPIAARLSLMNYAVVEVATGEIGNVLPDSLEGRVRTVGNLFTGPPAWSPASDRIAFLAGRPDEFRAVDVVYVAAREVRGGWTVRPLESDSDEKTAVGWSKNHLAWASRRRDGGSAITILRVSGDSIGPGFEVPGGGARITGLLPATDGLRFLVTRLGSVPRLIDLLATPRITHPDLPPATRLDSYFGWLNDRVLLAFRYPSPWKTELCAVVAVNGRSDWVMQAGHDADGLLPGPLGASPDEDPALYAAASPLPNAHAVTAPMLLVAGANDGQILPVNATAWPIPSAPTPGLSTCSCSRTRVT